MSRVLIVDDSGANLKLMSYELEKAGYEISTARSGREALARVKTTRPDMVLLDVLMPEMDGFETCRRFKADPEVASIPVLMWTSLDSTDDVVRGLEAGAQDYITKPFVAEVLRARIRSVLRSKEDRDALIETNARLEEAQRAARDSLNVRNEFLSHVSHELRTPLSTIHQFLTILIDGLAGPLNAEQTEYLEICLRNSRQLRSMIADLMEVTRLQHGKLRVAPRPLALEGVVSDVGKVQTGVAEAKGITLRWSVDAIPEVLADEGRVRQVLNNLIDNAIKFTPEGGEIHVHAYRDPERHSFVRLSVRDTGCGVHPDACERIFRYMQQEGDDDWQSRKGLGIGLFICKELVTRQDGKIWVESEVGKGSTFYFTLPEFDFVKLITPAVLQDGRLGEEYAVIRVDLTPSDPASSRGLAETVSRRAYHRVKTCIYPDDVLLPRFFCPGSQDTYFVVAGCDEAGKEALCARLRRNLGEPSHDAESGVHVLVRGLVLRPSAASRDKVVHEGVKDVADEVQRLTQIDSNWSK